MQASKACERKGEKSLERMKRKKMKTCNFSTTSKMTFHIRGNLSSQVEFQLAFIKYPVAI
jgi:hypothetical protein